MAASIDTPTSDNQIASRYAGSDLYSDITLRFGGKELKAHRIVLVSQSGWFANKLEGEGPPKEESDSDSAAPTAIQTLDLPPTDDPTHLTHLLTYLYTRHLPSLADPSNPSEPQAEACLRLLALYDLSNHYAVPTLSATAAARIKTILADLYAIARDLLTAFVPLLYDGRVLTAGDPGGLRAFVAGRAARDRLEGVAECEVGKWVKEFPEFGVDYLEASWEHRRTQVEQGQLKKLACRICKYAMEVAVTPVGEQKPVEHDSVSVAKPLDYKRSLVACMIRTCPNCRCRLEEQPLA